MSSIIGTRNLRLQEKKDLFLKIYPGAGTISAAARTIKVNPSTARDWIRLDPEFAKRFEEARQGFVENLEDIALGLVKEMADNRDYKANPTLLIFLLNGNAPEKYKGTTDSSSEARDVLLELRKMSKPTVINIEKPIIATASNEGAEKTANKWEEEKKALKEKFGSLKDDNPDSG